jgi:hypothetical protein
MEAIDRFKTLEMVADEQGNLSLHDPFLDSQCPNEQSKTTEPLSRTELRKLLTERTTEVEHLREELDHYQ